MNFSTPLNEEKFLYLNQFNLSLLEIASQNSKLPFVTFRKLVFIMSLINLIESNLKIMELKIHVLYFLRAIAHAIQVSWFALEVRTLNL